MKKILSLFLAVGLICLATIPAFAEELNQNTAEGTTTVEYTTKATYTIIIPAYIIPSETKEEATTYSVTATDVIIEDGNELKTTISYDGIMTDEKGAELEYTLYSENEEINDGDVILTQVAGLPNDVVQTDFIAQTETAKYAGVFTDTVTFNFAVVNKTYTTEEIDASEYLYPIGKTDPYYVVAKFNEDYTSVEIFKNGEDSDGLMMDWYNSNNSPMETNATTLTSAKIASGVSNIGASAFYYCNLTSVDIPNGLLVIGNNAFTYCTLLKSIVIPDSVTSLGRSAFAYCEQLKEIKLSSNLEKIDYKTFLKCNLEEIIIPNSVTSIGQSAFAYCGNLTSVDIPDSVKTIEYEAFLSTGLIEIVIPDSITSIERRTFSSCTNLENVVIGNGVESIGSGAFRGTKIANITIPDNVITIDDLAFAECTKLETAVIGNGVTSIAKSTFQACGNLKNVSLGNSVTSIGQYAFNGCYLTSITIPDSVTSIDEYAFTKVSTIYGTSGSYAETWATDNGYTFVAI